MDYRYANRGKTLEELITHANEYYRAKGFGMLVKVPTEFIPLRDRHGKVFDVKVTHKATVDFMGRWQGAPIAVEAKSTSSGMIRLDAVQSNQVRDLDTWISVPGNPGAIGLVVVSFDYERFFAVPWEYWSLAYELRVEQEKRKGEAHAYEWTIPEKVSLKPKDMLPEWEVYLMPWGLDYMGVAK